MASEPWAVAFRDFKGSPKLSERVRELPVEAQAALAMQHTELDRAACPEARAMKAVKAAKDSVVYQAQKVAEQIGSMRQSFTAGVPFAPPCREAKTPVAPIIEEEEEPQRNFKVGDKVEIYSNSKSTWCRGRVEEVKGEMVRVAYTFPGADPALGHAEKELPASHKDLRWAHAEIEEGADANGSRLPAQREDEDSDTEGKGNAAGPSATRMPRGPEASRCFKVGDKVEVYSNSRHTWCKGRVKELKGEMVQVAYAVPGADPAEGHAEKELPASHKDIRPANAAEVAAIAQGAWKQAKDMTARGGEDNDGAGSSPDGSGLKKTSKTAEDCWTGEELAQYQIHYKDAGEGDPQKAAAFLARSSLPRLTLKAVWNVGTCDMKKVLGPHEFYKCLRLVGHCQAMVETRRQLLEDGGEPLEAVLKGAAATAPPQLARFAGAS